jgi:hypothetical protein
MKKIFLTVVLLITTIASYSQCACCAGAGIGSSNGDYNNGILTLPKKMFLSEVYFDYRTIKDGNAPEEDEKLLTKMFITSLGFRYGITKNFTVSALLPYVKLYTNNGSDSGLGDLILLGTYTVYSKNKINFAIQGGIELPTGVQKNSSFDNTTVIVGSGSYDPMIGVIFSKQWDKLTLNGNVLYKHTTNGFQKNYYGSLSVHGVGVSYKIKGESTICEMDSSESNATNNLGLSATVSYSGEWLDKIKEDGVKDEDSGHYLGLANLGGAILYKKWAFPITFSLPIINEMNGLQNEFGYRLRVGVIRTF